MCLDVRQPPHPGRISRRANTHLIQGDLPVLRLVARVAHRAQEAPEHLKVRVGVMREGETHG